MGFSVTDRIALGVIKRRLGFGKANLVGFVPSKFGDLL